ncbi:MAG: tetratricopeptide repeat protein [bacterium]
MQNVQLSKSDKISFGIFLATIVLLVIGFVLNSVPSDLIKASIFIFGTTAALIAWSISRYKEGKLALPRQNILCSFYAVAFLAAVSSLFSGSIGKSLFGYGTESISASFLWTSAIFSLIGIMLLNTEKRILLVWKSLGILGFIFILFHFINIVFRFSGNVINLTGLWSDVSILAGVITLICGILLQKTELSKWEKTTLYILIAFGLFTEITLTIWFPAFWWVSTVFALVLGIVAFFNSGKKLIPWAFIAIFIVTATCSFFPNFVGDNLQKFANHFSKTPNTFFSATFPDRAVSTWGITLGVTKGMLKDNPFFGPGPNNYIGEYLKNRPEEANYSNLWTGDFNYAIGIVPTIMISTGILGIIAGLIFLVFLAFRTMKTIFSKTLSNEKKFIVYAPAVSSLFLWIMLVIHASGVLVFTLAVLSTVLYISALSLQNKIKTLLVNEKGINSGRITVYIIISVLIALMLLSTWKEGKRLFASLNFSDAVSATSNGNSDFVSAEISLNKSVSLTGFDIYYQSLLDLNILKMNRVASDTSLKTPESIQEFKNSYLNASSAAMMAINADPNNYINYISFAKFAEASIDLKIPGSFEMAKEQYTKALVINPSDPTIHFALGRLEFLNGDIEGAIKELETAIKLKSDYVDVAVVLSKLYESQKDFVSAANAMNYAIEKYLPKREPQLYYELGRLLYLAGNYDVSIQSLTLVVNSIPDYSNARYFLGLSLAKKENYKDAVTQFQAIKKYNPDNKEVDTIIDSLQNGYFPNLDNKAAVAPNLIDGKSTYSTTSATSTVTTKKKK